MALLPFRWARGRPLQCGLFDSSALRRVVAEEMARGVDLVHLELARLDDLAHRIGTMPLFVDFVDALSLSTERRARRARWVYVRSSMRRRGASGGSRPDCSVARVAPPWSRRRTPVPSARLRTCTSFPSAWIRRLSVRARPRDGATVMFTGNLGYFANVDAISWFARNVWPHVLSRCPARASSSSAPVPIDP